MTAWKTRLIVAGTDGSEGSIRAINLAAEIARAQGAALHVLTVVRPPEGWWGMVGSPPSAESLGNALARAQSEMLDATIAAADVTGVEVTSVEELGDPASRLVGYCRDNEADLLVIGKRGAGLVERIIVGSVADRVVHMTDCPVLVVP